MFPKMDNIMPGGAAGLFFFAEIIQVDMVFLANAGSLAGATT